MSPAPAGEDWAALPSGYGAGYGWLGCLYRQRDTKSPDGRGGSTHSLHIARDIRIDVGTTGTNSRCRERLYLEQHLYRSRRSAIATARSRTAEDRSEKGGIQATFVADAPGLAAVAY